jgi:monovalent cation:H+ antiporter-2, CPA2 family
MDDTLLFDIVKIFTVSTLVNILFSRFKTPAVVGYLLTGVLLGPYVFSLVSESHSIEILAEIGVIFLLFTIGIEFSLKHLMKIRRIVFFGGLLQVVITAGAILLVSRIYELDWKSAVFIGFLSALSSSALVLKLLQERSEITSNYGRTVLGILIFQDLMLVPLLLITNLMGSGTSNLQIEVLVLILKMILILGIVYVGYRWIMPKLFLLIAKTKSQEVFMMSIFMVGLGVSLITNELGMSLAFGAFLAGLMISESDYSHQAFSSLITFKDIFTSFFFVSIGMMLDLDFVRENYALVLLSVLILILVKFIVAGGTGFVLGHTFRGTVLIGLALSQVGEFSFLLARIGLDLDLIDSYFYQLFLAVAILSMTITPFLMKVGVPLSKGLSKLPIPDRVIKGLYPLPEMDMPNIQNHIVIIGKDSIAQKLSVMARQYQISSVSVIFDPLLAKERMEQGELVVYGDALNEPILQKAQIQFADIAVVSIRNTLTAAAIIEKIRTLNPSCYIITSAINVDTMADLYHAGADQVIPEKFEIAVDFFSRILQKQMIPIREINRIVNSLRLNVLGLLSEKDTLNKPSLLDEFRSMRFSALTIESLSQAEQKTLVELDLRRLTGATLLAIQRGETMIEHPTPDIIFQEGDIAYLIGNPEQINRAWELFSSDQS